MQAIAHSMPDSSSISRTAAWATDMPMASTGSFGPTMTAHVAPLSRPSDALQWPHFSRHRRERPAPYWASSDRQEPAENWGGSKLIGPGGAAWRRRNHAEVDGAAGTAQLPLSVRRIRRIWPASLTSPR
jgi:hypothetical protein